MSITSKDIALIAGTVVATNSVGTVLSTPSIVCQALINVCGVHNHMKIRSVTQCVTGCHTYTTNTCISGVVTWGQPNGLKHRTVKDRDLFSWTCQLANKDWSRSSSIHSPWHCHGIWRWGKFIASQTCLLIRYWTNGIVGCFIPPLPSPQFWLLIRTPFPD